MGLANRWASGFYCKAISIYKIAKAILYEAALPR